MNPNGTADFSPVIKKDDREYFCVATPEGLDQLCALVQLADTVAIDWETTSAEYWLPDFEVLGLAVAVRPSEGFYIPMNHRLPDQALFFQTPPPNLPLPLVIQRLGPLLEERTLVCHNTKFDIPVSKRVGMPYGPKIEDSYIAAGLTNDTREHSLSLKHLTRARLGREATEIGDVTGTKSFNMVDSPIELVTEYAAADACNCLALWELQQQKLERWSRVNEVYRKLEMPIVPVVANMEQRGFLIDRGILEDIQRRATEDIARSLATMVEIAGYPFDPGNTEHKAQILYDRFGLPVARRGGRETTERKALEVLFELMDAERKEAARPFFEAFITHSKAEKVRSTYTQSIWERVDPEGRVHPSFFQLDTTTGRMSSGKPINFQNMPRDKATYDIRSAFIPGEGYQFVLADYVQMEFKIGAGLSQDPDLVRIANDPDADVHINTAAACFNVKPEDVTAPQRQAAKTLTYAIQFGATPAGVSKLLNCHLKEAERLVRAFYNEAYPGLRDWTERVQGEIQRRGYAETYYGRRRWGDLNLLRSRQEQPRMEEFRKLVNMIVQGTGADVAKLAMKKVDRWFRSEGLRSQIVGQIHDELVILCPEDEASKVMYYVEELMTSQVLDVTLPVDASIRSSLSKSEEAILAGKG